MSADGVVVRCLRCGGLLQAAPAPGPQTRWVSCPYCGQPVAVVSPHARPPLYGWEVYPHLYPPLHPPRLPRFDLARIISVSLVVCLVGLVAAGGWLAYLGWSAQSPNNYFVGGTVYESVVKGGGESPASGVLVQLTGDNGYRVVTLSGGGGRFSFANVPAGGITVNASAPGYSPDQLELFASAVYTSPGLDSLSMVLVAGPVGNETTTVSTPFPDLNAFVASLWSGTSVGLVAALVAGVGATWVIRRRQYVFGVAGGMATLLTPIAIVVLGLTTAVPILLYPLEGLAAAGLLVTGLAVLRLAQTGDPLPPEA